MEEELELLEQMVQRQPCLILEPIAEPTTETITTTTTPPPTTAAKTATNARKTPGVHVREIQEVRLHLVKKVEPYDPTKPGFKRPTKRPIIRPDSASLMGLAKPVTATNPGPRIRSPQLAAKPPQRAEKPLEVPPTTAPTDTNEVWPARATTSFPKRKRRVGENSQLRKWPKLDSSPKNGFQLEPATTVAKKSGIRRSGTPKKGKRVITNPGPLKMSSPQLAITKPKPTTSSTLEQPRVAIGTGRKIGVVITNPGLRARSPQLETTTATWLEYDDAPLLSEYPSQFESLPGDLFEPPRKIRTPLERLLLSLTPLAEVQPKVVKKKAVFTAYDDALSLYKVTRCKYSRTPKIESMGKTAWDMLARLREREE
ncbi:mucin-2-like [Microplitis mediator]|uniref:mucin-2-like n=1 Tax=Microplitis mediator TaxID=375433 RepID=UPI002552F6E8|nr:mucin-2-like [Microplitis mediator]